MSERGIIFLVVAALFIGAFLFPYENDDSSYFRSSKPTPPQKPIAGQVLDAGGPHLVDNPNSVDGKFPGGSRGPALNGAARAQDQEAAMRQVVVVQGQIPSQRDGFPDGQWLKGTWVLVTENLKSDSPKEASTDLPSITFNVDGTFTEHMLLSQGNESPTADKPRPDFEGKYRLQQFTLSITRTDAAAEDDEALSRRVNYVACPLAGENAQGLPIRLFISGKVLQYQN